MKKMRTVKPARRRRRHHNPLRRALFVLICLIMTAGLFAGYRIFNPQTSVVYAEESLSDLKYKVVRVEEGDSLWSIARENMSPGFHDIREYIREIKDCNQMESDQINAGSYLMVPYYEIAESSAAK